MKKILTSRKLISMGCVLMLSLSTHLFAAENLIQWVASSQLPSSITVGGTSHVITYTFTNNAGFNIPAGILNIDHTSSTPASAFSFVDNCSGQALAKNASCTVVVTVAPKSAGEVTLQLKIDEYSNWVVKVPAQTSTAVGSSADVTATEPVMLPATMTVGETEPFQFKFTNSGSVDVSNVNVVISPNAQVTSNQCNQPPFTLSAGGSCIVAGQYTAVSGDSGVVTGDFSYQQGPTVQARTSTTISQPPSGLVAKVTQPHSVMRENMNYQFDFEFTNNTTNTLVLTQAPTITVPNLPPAALTVDASGCFSGNPTNFAPGSCTITATVNTNEPPLANSDFEKTYVLTANMMTSGAMPLTASASTNSFLTKKNTRQITFVNQCPFPVWFSLNGGNRQNYDSEGKNGVDIKCNDGETCPEGSTCGVNSGPLKPGSSTEHEGECFWNNYGPASGSFKLDAAGGTTTTAVVQIPKTARAGGSNAGAKDAFLDWTGNLAARVGCDGTDSCLLGACGGAGGSQACAPGVGFGQPSTQGELALGIGTVQLPGKLQPTPDTYDVEVINGFTVPIKIAPDSPAPSSVKGYLCNAAGSETAVAGDFGIGACKWTDQATPPGPDPSIYRFVSTIANAKSCTATTSSDPCNVDNEVCGLTIGMKHQCGKFLGYWTPNEACSVNPSAAQPYFNCTTSINSLDAQSPFPASQQVQTLYACATPDATKANLNTCYLATYPGGGNVNTCCGCVNWEAQDGVKLPKIGTQPGETEACQHNVNSGTWFTVVHDRISWLKKACPSAYIYQYDDKSSTFNCTAADAGSVSENSQNYTVTFCPGGDSGLPSGLTTAFDGRG